MICNSDFEKKALLPNHCHLHLKLNGKHLYLTDSVKYFGIKIDENLACFHQINKVAAKLNKANDMLSKIRHFVDFKRLKSIYHEIF